jgi:hypothetical protein
MFVVLASTDAFSWPLWPRRTTIRRPDLSIIAPGRCPNGRLRRNGYLGAPICAIAGILPILPECTASAPLARRCCGPTSVLSDLLGTIDSGRISSEKGSRTAPPAVIPSTSSVMIAATVIGPAVVIPTIRIAAVMIATTAKAAGAGVTAGIGISVTAGVGSRSRAIPTTTTPG